ncbi:MAG: membrane protein insertion efficiency factor YidD [Spirochaetaceae bacterium]|nr:MAG: membrane protein insertion efficiency factor YidD [Spirochaetaceae bacterium]
MQESSAAADRRRPFAVRAVRALFVLPIWLYRQIVSPWLPQSCIYTPSCSRYAHISIMQHGVFKGLLLALARVLRCSALFSGGQDPVPQRFSFSELRDGYRRFHGRTRRQEDSGGA